MAALAAVMLSEAQVQAAEPQGLLELHARFRTQGESAGSPDVIGTRTLSWDPRETAVVICDMWNQHWCQGATRRVAEMAPRMNEVIATARRQGVLIIHAPSSCMDAYRDTPQRKLAQRAPEVATTVPLQSWCHLDAEHEGALPIDDSDGGCDCQPQCETRTAWSRQIATLQIEPGDAITDSAEAFYLMKQRGIKNVIVMGVHTNMCVLGRPFSIRQMVYQGQNVVLMRDMTDSMYNSRKAPFVPHVRGTELVIEHIEKHWCPTITSTDFLGKPAFRFAEDKRPHVAFLVNENHYHSAETLRQFAGRLQDRFDYYITFIDARPGRGFVGSEALATADLAVLFARREALTPDQQTDIQQYLDAGKPLVALRTASHAFGAKEPLPPGLINWNEFDKQVLGGNYSGHLADGCQVQVVPGRADHPLLAGIDVPRWESGSSLYEVSPIDPKAVVLLTGTKDGKDEQPVAWTRDYGRARVFYTSLGHPDDFEQPQFEQLLINAVHWGMGKEKVSGTVTGN